MKLTEWLVGNLLNRLPEPQLRRLLERVLGPGKAPACRCGHALGAHRLNGPCRTCERAWEDVRRLPTGITLCQGYELRVPHLTALSRKLEPLAAHDLAKLGPYDRCRAGFPWGDRACQEPPAYLLYRPARRKTGHWFYTHKELCVKHAIEYASRYHIELPQATLP